VEKCGLDFLALDRHMWWALVNTVMKLMFK
jgi:hypothetical protein